MITPNTTEITAADAVGITPGQVMALFAAGYAIVPRQMTIAQTGARMLQAHRDHHAQYAAVIEEGRLKA